MNLAQDKTRRAIRRACPLLTHLFRGDVQIIAVELRVNGGGKADGKRGGGRNLAWTESRDSGAKHAASVAGRFGLLAVDIYVSANEARHNQFAANFT